MFHVTVDVNSMIENAIQSKNGITRNFEASVKNNKTLSMQRRLCLESWYTWL